MTSGIYSPTTPSNVALEPKKATCPVKILMDVFTYISPELYPHEDYKNTLKSKLKYAIFTIYKISKNTKSCCIMTSSSAFVVI